MLIKNISTLQAPAPQNGQKQFIYKLPTNCLSVFDHFLRLTPDNSVEMHLDFRNMASILFTYLPSPGKQSSLTLQHFGTCISGLFLFSLKYILRSVIKVRRQYYKQKSKKKEIYLKQGNLINPNLNSLLPKIDELKHILKSIIAAVFGIPESKLDNYCIC